ncbi:MAG TPA: DEAD/DEAH box helicase [Anaerolineales bacterium]|nr:DEAD/DEAH box helicase [Anaerolineales bacterium]
MGIEQALESIRMDGDWMRNIAVWERLPPREARYGEIPSELDPRLKDALHHRGLAPLYTHQAAAVESALAGENVVIVTGTASGKTLAYNLPVLHRLLGDPEARALYLFPTKALAQDQAAELAVFLEAIGPQAIAVRMYDGDTPAARRRSVREEARLLISNPDMLHAGILPHHPRWASFLENLRWIVLDELHVYRGVFGSNVANLLRRLRRLCRFYGSEPRFILTSATIANPKDLAERLIESDVRLIPADLDGSPRAEKHILFYNPPVIDPRLGIRRAYTLEATRWAARFVDAGVQTAVFARSRRTTEVVLGYLRDSVAEAGGDPQRVRGYRGGYLPLERRAIERGLRQGQVQAVVATNALELGVDIGQLGASILAGYPGTLASMWQQAGRAGRRSEASASVLVASGAPLDQFIVAHPAFVFERSPEHGLIHPDNLAILVRHLRCAAFELPFGEDESFGSYPHTRQLLEVMAEDGELHHSGGAYRWVADEYPAESVSLRASGDDTVIIQQIGEGRPVVIGEVDRQTAPVLVHEGAVYSHEGRTFLVQSLDWENGLADVKAAEVDYYTDAAEAVDLTVLEAYDADEGGDARRAHGRVRLTAQATSFRMVKRYTHETLGYGEIDLPPREFETTACWLWLAPETVARLEAEGVLLAPNDYGPDWMRASAAARQRDGFRCRQCGAPERPGRVHDVHHLQPFRSFGYVAGSNRKDLEANALDNLITLCSTCHHRAEAARGTRSALGGLSYALGNIAPLFLMCDARDLGSLAETRSRATRGPTITLYDRVPEGLGLAERLYEVMPQLLQGAMDLIGACGCVDGCPACVGPVGEGSADVKELTSRLLDTLLEVPDSRAG